MVPEGWEEKTIAECLRDKKSMAYGILQPGDDVEGGVPMLRTVDIAENGMSNTKVLRVSQELHQEYSRTSLEGGEVLFSVMGTVGRGMVVPDLCKGWNVNRALAVIRLNEGVDPYYFCEYLKSPFINDRLKEQAIGSAQKRINLGDLKKHKVNIPPLVEQHKIANILSAWDDAIATTEQLLANSEQQKKTLTQQLLTGKMRLPEFGQSGSGGFRQKTLPDGWAYERIGDFAEEVAERNTEREESPVLSCSKYDGFVDSLKYFKKKVYSSDTSNYKVIRRGEFGFPANHVEEGSIGLQSTYERGIVSPIYVVFRVDSERVDKLFLYKMLKTDHYRQVFAASTSASVDRRGSLRWKQFSNIKVPLPNLEEQKAISRVIQLSEREEKLLKQSLEKLRSEKRALMQQLLTGKRRVKTAESEPATA